MKREFINNMTMIEIHRYLRRINATLIRMIPKRQPKGHEAYVILYLPTQTPNQILAALKA